MCHPKMSTIREMRLNDLDAALRMINEEGWGYTISEMERMLRLEPVGSFVCVDNDPIGVVTTVAHGSIGVIGHLVVTRNARGGGVGRDLLNRALEYLRSRGCDSIVVIATNEGVPVYSKFGFKVQREVLCKHFMVEEIHTRIPFSRPAPMRKGDIKEVARIDAELFGADRLPLIQLLYEESPESCFKLAGDEGITGLCMGRKTATGYDLGPWICRPSSLQYAQELLNATLSAAGPGRIFSGLFADNSAAVAISEKLPLFRFWSTKLMTLGKPRAYTDVGQIFGIAAFELG